MNGLTNDAVGLVWPLLLIVGYPLAAVAVLEVARGVADRSPFTASVLRQIAYVLLPTAAIWLILRLLAELPPENVAVRVAETAFALTSLYLLLRVAQAVLTSFLDEKTQAPKLLLDILRIGLSMLWGAIVVSSIWNVDLGSLIAAMGVGSIVLGFALQEFLGNLLSGLGLLSAHKFGEGDWIVVDGDPARVVEMDWRTVTLIDAGGNRIVVANSTLAKGNLVIAARAQEPAWAGVTLTIGVDVPPERVRDAVFEAASAVPGLAEDRTPKCLVTELAAGGIGYLVRLPVANPGILSGPRDEFLSRFWYIAQRHGIPLGGEAPADASAEQAARLAMLEQNGALSRDPDALPILARAARLQSYRRGDVLLAQGAAADDVLLVVGGTLGTYVGSGEDSVRLELVGAGQLLALQEMMVQGASPVRIVAEKDADVLAIPSAVLTASFGKAPLLARDIRALTEARRQAIIALQRGIRDAA